MKNTVLGHTSEFFHIFTLLAYNGRDSGVVSAGRTEPAKIDAQYCSEPRSKLSGDCSSQPQKTRWTDIVTLRTTLRWPFTCFIILLSMQVFVRKQTVIYV